MKGWKIKKNQMYNDIMDTGSYTTSYRDCRGFEVYLVILTRRLLRTNTRLDIYRTCRQVFSTVGCKDVILQMPESQISLLQESKNLAPQAANPDSLNSPANPNSLLQSLLHLHIPQHLPTTAYNSLNTYTTTALGFLTQAASNRLAEAAGKRCSSTW